MFAFAARSLLLPALAVLSAQTAPDAAPAGPSLDYDAGQRAGGAEVFRAIQLHYPDDYRGLTQSLAREAAAKKGDGAALAALRSHLLAAFFRNRAKGLANAPAPLLNGINARHLLLIRLLAHDDAALCADFATSLFIGRYDLPAFYQERATSLSVSILEAAKAGEKLPPNPAREGLGGDDAASWYAQLLLVEPSSDIQAAIAADGDGLSGTPEMQCRVGAATFGAIEKLEPESAANVGAFFLAQILSELEPGKD
jgi:hypothetical protein